MAVNQAEPKPLPQQLRDVPPPPRREPAAEASNMPKLGERVWYRLRTNLELVPAEVVEGCPNTDDPSKPTKYLAARYGTVHLRVEVEPERHFAASNEVYRQNVAECEVGKRTGGTFTRTKGADEDEWLQRRLYRLSLEQDIRARMSRGEKPLEDE